jgi:arylsulfatase A-like enzyme
MANCNSGVLENQKAAPQPWLCYVAFNLPHDPRVAGSDFHRRYDPAKLPLPTNFLPQHPFNNGELVIRDEQLLPWPRTAEALRKELADYYACVSFVDVQVGRIFAALRAAGAEENTLIVFASDHGLALGSHGLLGKQNLYEHSMRAPLIMAGPSIPATRKSDAFCYLADIFPTLGELAGVPAPAGSEGISLAPVIAGTATKVRDAIFTAYTKVQRAARDERWKLIVYPQINKTQLFDLQKDPDEISDLSKDPEARPQIERLKRLLEDWQAKVGDPLPLTTAHPQPEAFEFPKRRAAAELKEK